MNLTSLSLKNPAIVAIIGILLLGGGFASLYGLPIQLFPDIERPQIVVRTQWRAASPEAMESEIIEPQEAVLQGLPGLLTMASYINQGNANINLSFQLGTDMDSILIEVISRMNRIANFPVDATPPMIMQGGWGSSPALTYFFIQALPGNQFGVDHYQQYINDRIIPEIENIQGVSSVELNNAPPEELQIQFDPYRAAQLGLVIPDIARLAGPSQNTSGGFVDIGRRQFTLKFNGRYSPEQLKDKVLDWREGRAIRLGDVADVRIAHSDQRDFAIQNGNPAVSIRINRENKANVLETLNRVKDKIESLRGELLTRGLGIEQSFDASVFIYRAIGLVRNNLFLGTLLAISILWWFMRKLRATLIISMAIPASIMSTFIVLQMTGRSLNVISLAGLAFAVGMVLDAAIVVYENILKHHEKGDSPYQSALKGTLEIWPALLASTLTTVAIFIPVVFLKDVAGQLFADLALTIAIAVTMSLIVAITLLPVIAKRGLSKMSIQDPHKNAWIKISSMIMTLTSSSKKRWAVISSLAGASLFVFFFMVPELDYLPPVKRDAIDTYFSFPPASNTSILKSEIIDTIAERLQPFMDGKREPALKNYYIIIWPSGGTMGVRAKEQSQVDELLAVIKDEILVGFPDLRAFPNQGNLFGGLGSDRSISLHLQSSDSNKLMAAANTGMALIREEFDDSSVRAQPDVQLAEPEFSITPKDRRLAELGFQRGDIATIIRSLGNGIFLGEYFNGDQRMDIIFKSSKWDSSEQLTSIPLATPSGVVVPLSEIVELTTDVGPSELRRINKRRTITLSITPPETMSLETAINLIEEKIEPGIRDALPDDGNLLYGGSASSLSEAIASMSKNFMMAFALLFLLLSAVFKSVRDATLVVFSLPLATGGGILAIQLLNLFTFQPLDLLTMIGFVILLGLIVNNAILLVMQTRHFEEIGIDRNAAVEKALLSRLRPIFMSSLTSIFGMLPLLLMPGIGSVIYRGLAAVIVGGMVVGTLFTLVLLPSLLRMGARPMSIENNDSQPLLNPMERAA